ncbi:GntR family transcriptional regulator [Phaeobacter inhibens]|uniref:GntR family transcriptional regulator n=1 Tax=Phaeobacter inhibens TaxID=221822 RepID=UPI000C9BE6CA|nr:GntR family transcriptional regulator [Phaeobacter inhibens]AUQ69111.1 transcriptional regulator, GntR family [Phaeobacter inhibens]UWR84659.1 GntR family transcriptional regulator [Phaeobacter inhibens]
MPRASDTLIEQLKHDIFSGLLKPGDQLEEADLAARFGVSRTPIREAIRSMVDCGLLETRPRKGAIVRVLTAKELNDLFEVAAELESMACRLASDLLTRSGKKDIEAGLDLCRVAVEAEDIPAYAQANLAFHAAIHKASGNAWLVDQLDQIQARINVYRLMPYEVVGRLEKSLAEHRDISDAIFAKNGALANTLMRDHMMLQGARLPSLLKALE